MTLPVTSLVLAFALAADAGAGIGADAGADAGLFDAPLYATCPDAPPVISLDGGWLLVPPERGARLACLLTTCETYRQAQARAYEEPPYWWLQTTGVVVAVAIIAFSIGKSL